MRQDAVAEILHHEQIHFEVAANLAKFKDLNRFVSQLVRVERPGAPQRIKSYQQAIVNIVSSYDTD